MAAQDERDGMAWMMGTGPPSETIPWPQDDCPFPWPCRHQGAVAPRFGKDLYGAAYQSNLVHPVHPCKSPGLAKLRTHEIRRCLDVQRDLGDVVFPVVMQSGFVLEVRHGADGDVGGGPNSRRCRGS